MSLNEEVDVLRNIPMFSNIEPSKLKLLAFTSERLTFQQDQLVCKQGDMDDSMYVIIGGAVDVIINLPTGPLTVASMRKNDFFGDLALLCDMPRTATIQATSELTTLRISKDLFYRLATEFPQMAIEVMRVMAQRLVKTTNDLQQIRTELDKIKADTAAPDAG